MIGVSLLIVTTDPLTAAMPGPAIRALNLAEQLARTHQVTLATSGVCERTHDSVRMIHAEGAELQALAAVSEGIVGPGSFVRRYPWIRDLEVPLAIDLYDPYHLENLEPDGHPIAEQAATVSRLTEVVTEDLGRGDFFFCASERQRDFWLGSLASAGRVNPYTYGQDPGLHRLIDVVPFGIPQDPPIRQAHGLRATVPGIGRDDRILLWGGGVYNWFDPLSLLLAVELLKDECPDLRLVFLGMGHPNPEIPDMRVASELRAESERRGLTGRQVVFLEGWVPYDRRADYLLDADIGVSTSPDHVESRFAFRTRVLDYLWAGLPTLLTAGDALAEVIDTAGAGVVVPPGDPEAIASGIRKLLRDPPNRETVTELGARYHWDRVVEPLVTWCRNPSIAVDRAAARQAESGEPRSESGAKQPVVTSLSTPPSAGDRNSTRRSRVLSRLRRAG
jgi:glycosyltransferase involved in cell wall biosynthesis